MSIKFSLVELRNPMRPQDAKKVYARAQVRDEIDIYRIGSEIAYSTSLTEADVMSVILALIRKTKEHLADGDLVSLGELGRFQYQLSSEGAETKDKFTSANIKKVRIQFRPGQLLRPSIQHLKFEQVISVKARKQALKNG